MEIVSVINKETQVKTRRGKEINLNWNDNICVKYGATDRHNPEVVFLIGRMWLIPKFEQTHYKIIVDEIFNNFKRKIVKEIQNSELLISNRYVFDLDVKTTLMRKDKKSFAAFEIHVKQVKKLSYYDMLNELQKMFEPILNKLITELNFYNFDVIQAKG